MTSEKDIILADPPLDPERFRWLDEPEFNPPKLAPGEDTPVTEEGKKAVNQVPDDKALWEQIRVILQGVMIRHAARVARAAVDYKADLGMGVDFDQVDQEILAFTRAYTNDWWDKLEGVTRDALRETLVTWQESGLGERGLEDLVDQLGTVFFDEVRARRIAVTEVTRIFDQGNRLAEVNAGFSQQKWLTARDEIVCKKLFSYNGVDYQGCGGLDGLIFPINEGPFPVEDTHINCRCLRTAITDEGEVFRD
jgi:hypothetical protein